MGRTVPTWRNRLEKRIDYWRDFKRALRPGERDSLENLASAVRRRSSACGMLPLSDEFEPIVLAMLIDIDTRLSPSVEIIDGEVRGAFHRLDGVVSILHNVSAALDRLEPRISPCASTRPTLPVSSKPPRPVSSSTAVRVTFTFKGTNLGPLASLYWLAGNSTEHFYSEIPRGMRVTESTRAGKVFT